jgi:mannose-6-phosphate isomerase-like protein (cupin superfamily)
MSRLHEKASRPWGNYTVIEEGQGFIVKIIHVNKGQRLSLQSHNHRCEHWVVLSGVAKVVLDDSVFDLSVGQSVDIPLRAKHSLQNPYESDLEILEIQMGDLLSEDDIIRYEDIYGRA